MRCPIVLRNSKFSSKAFGAEARPFDEIPGPRGFPFLGTLLDYLPIIGKYDPKKLREMGAAKYAEYGPVVREEIKPGEPIVYVYRPEDIAEVYKADGGWHPERRSHLALLKYREDRRGVYNTGGLLPTNGPDWWRLRKEFQKALSKPQLVKYLPDADGATAKFARLCELNEFQDLTPLLSRLFLRNICSVAFDLEIDVYSEEEMRPGSLSSKLIDAAFDSNNVIYDLDNGPKIWRYFDTPKYRRFCEAQSCMEKVAVQMVSEKIGKLRHTGGDAASRGKESLLDTYLQNPALDHKDVIGMACDMLLAGIDTTTYASAFALYHLSNNPRVQEKLHVEASKLIANENDAITEDTLREAYYTKAVIKETFRINPISLGVGRILHTDVVLNGYHVPKGTYVVTHNEISCRSSEYFDNPNSFIPERWHRDADGSKKQDSIHPYLVVPFGHGSRSCIARRLAEQSMQTLLLRMCRNLKFHWEGGDLDIISTPINKPNVPMKLKFCSRT
ncbi:cytochrome P450 302a1, mitochondrial [Copidosoma floridanum]|uniref:cytochrome P450 302a1, mitochondrial n=1 Tax=Copidosoma floridanum TaxID=29053 RepID=UPI0006C9D743|nr:cytochrome P450 302a1, mitochondrial [Copidosoma floridanum]